MLPLHLLLGTVAAPFAVAAVLVLDPLVNVACLLALVRHLPGERPSPWPRYWRAYGAAVRAWLLIVLSVLFPLVGPLLAGGVALGVALAPLMALDPDEPAPVRASWRLLNRRLGPTLFLLLLVGGPTFAVLVLAGDAGGAGVNLWARYAQELALVVGGNVLRLVLWANLVRSRAPAPAAVAEVFE